MGNRGTATSSPFGRRSVVQSNGAAIEKSLIKQGQLRVAQKSCWHIMLVPDNSIFVIANSSGANFSANVGTITRRLADVASLLSVPIIIANYPANCSTQLIDTECSMRDDFLRIPFEPGTAEWRSSKLATALVETGRRKLLICGYWLEEGVSLLALHASLVGFDSYVTVDLSPALCPELSPILQMRLVQHNVVVTTSTQVLREWAALAVRHQQL